MTGLFELYRHTDIIVIARQFSILTLQGSFNTKKWYKADL